MKNFKSDCIRIFIILVCATVCLVAQTRPLPAPVREVSDSYFGTTVVDPYRWMEDEQSAELRSWVKSQNEYTRQIIDRIPGREELLSRLMTLSNAGPVVSEARQRKRRYFYFKLLPGEDSRSLYVREDLAGRERLLVDPRKYGANGQHASIDYFEPSWDGRFVAYGVSRGGSEESILYVVDVATGRELEEKIDRTRFARPSWHPDNRSFFYWREQSPPPGAPPSSRYLNSRSYRHVLGTDASGDQPVLGHGVSRSVEISEFELPFVTVSPASNYAIGVTVRGVQRRFEFYTAPLSSIDGPSTAWRKIASVSDSISDYAVCGDDIFFLTYRDAPRRKLIRTSLSKPDIANAAVVLPQAGTVLETLISAGDAVYVKELDGGVDRMRRVPSAAPGKAEYLDLPFNCTIEQMDVDPQSSGVLLKLVSWARPAAIYSYHASSGRVVDTRLQPRSPVDMSGIESTEVKAKSKDGALVPLSIVHKRRLSLDGSHIALLQGYGAYGTSLKPSFVGSWLPWFERGGVLAVAHVRGGGEYGEQWRVEGQKQKKQNSIDDFIACAEYLINHGYTSPERLAAEGFSAGGILIGGAVTQRPELFGAAVGKGGLYDTLRFEVTAGGPANVAEFGTVKTPEGFKSLEHMSAYNHVKPEISYPAFLLATGLNDSRVPFWQAAKMAARLQSTSSRKPALLRVDYESGHGVGTTRTQSMGLLADEMIFLFWNLGVKEFQPFDKPIKVSGAEK